MDSSKTALVTGGARRIGRAICETLAEAGYRVAVHYNTSSKEAESLVSALRDNGAEAHAIQADLTSVTQTRALVPKAVDAIGPLDVLVNNASLFAQDDFDMADETIWDAHFAVHVKAPCVLTAALAERLPKDRTGLVVNMIDQRVLKPSPQFASYTLSKSALLTATKTMAQRYAPRLRINALGPGPTLPSSRQNAEDFRAQVEALPLKTGPAPKDFGRSILHIADIPSITGQMIALDGGQHLAWQTPDMTIDE